MNKANFIIYIIPVFLLGCSSTGYSSTINEAISDVEIGKSCPDFSGAYDAVGHLMPGEKNARALSATKYFDRTFPITDPENWKKLRESYRRGSYRTFQNVLIDPDFAVVSNEGSGSVRISLGYEDADIGSYVSDYKAVKNIHCAGGKIIWSGAGNIEGQSEWGKNTSYFSYALYQDKEGNLISESLQKVRMTSLFGMPGGTAEYFSSYLFRRKER